MLRWAVPRVGRLAATLLAGLTAIALAGCATGFLGSAPGPATPTAPVSGEVLGTGATKVALLLPLSATGNAGQLAMNMKNAADLALREFPNAQIQILVKDDSGTADGARAAATQAISEGAKLILGPLFAQSVSAAAAVAKPAHVPIVAFSTDATSASAGVYLLGFLPQSDVDRIIAYAAAQGKRSFAALLPNNAYGTLVEAALQKAVAAAGGRVTALDHYDLDRGSMQTKAAAFAAVVKGGTVDAVFLPGGADEAPFLADILAAGGVRSSKIKYLGSSQWDDSHILSESNLSGGDYPGADNTGFASFAQRYQAAFGSPPNRKASLAYDATSLAAGLATRYGNDAYTEKVLTSASGFIGVDGAFRLLANGLNQRGLAVYEIRRGAAVVVDPAPKSFAKPGF